MNKRKEKLTQLYQLGVKVDLNAVKTILYTDKLRSAISEFMRYLRADAYFLTGNQMRSDIHTPTLCTFRT